MAEDGEDEDMAAVFWGAYQMAGCCCSRLLGDCPWGYHVISRRCRTHLLSAYSGTALQPVTVCN
jgi:hypothetical protein